MFWKRKIQKKLFEIETLLKFLKLFSIKGLENIIKKVPDFPDGTVVKNSPANAGDPGSRPGPGRSHSPRSN